MPLIDRTYFDGDLLLVGVNEEAIGQAIDAAIAQYEPEYYDKVFGVAFAELFIAGINSGLGGAFSSAFSSAFNTGSISNRWRWIRDGKLFTLPNGRSIRWQGLRNARKMSAIACYVYFEYRRRHFTMTGQAGNEGTSQSENAAVASANTKMVKAWNLMVEYNCSLATILRQATVNDELLYPEFQGCHVDADLFQFINIHNV